LLDSLLQELVSGRLDPHDDEDSSVDVLDSLEECLLSCV